LRDLQIQLDSRVSRGEAAVQVPRQDGSWFRAELDCQLMRFNNPISAKNETKKYNNSALKKIDYPVAFSSTGRRPAPTRRVAVCTKG
jgi:hypothetical protein